MARMTCAALDDLRDRNPVQDVAGRWVTLRAATRGRFVGPCPICSGNRASRTASRFECDSRKWVCAVCADGGDVIRLVERVEGLGFREAVQHLGGVLEIDPETAARRDRERAERQRLAELDANEKRERERVRCWQLWRGAAYRRIVGTVVADYFRLRGLEVPDTTALRCALDWPYYHPGPDGKPRILHRGPAMLAAIQDSEGRFAGLHVTPIDLSQPDGKARIVDPETGEALQAKKVRGDKQGGVIRLIAPETPRRLVMGEGIETSLSPWTAMLRAGRDLSDTAIWSSVDLGNMGGRALETVPHPTEADRHGRPRRVPGLEPDMSVPGIVIPESVRDIILLGDGDSDRFLTETTLKRAARRYAAPERVVRSAWAHAGQDFNDMLRGKQ